MALALRWGKVVRRDDARLVELARQQESFRSRLARLMVVLALR